MKKVFLFLGLLLSTFCFAQRDYDGEPFSDPECDSMFKDCSILIREYDDPTTYKDELDDDCVYEYGRVVGCRNPEAECDPSIATCSFEKYTNPDGTSHYMYCNKQIEECQEPTGQMEEVSYSENENVAKTEGCNVSASAKDPSFLLFFLLLIGLPVIKRD